MTNYSEENVIETIEKNHGEIKSYFWNGDNEEKDYRFVRVFFAVGGQRDFDADELAKEYGCAAVEFVVGGIAAFSGLDERDVWANQI